MTTRRNLIAKAAWAALATQVPRWAWAVVPMRHDPFALGVASGDPLPDSVVLWTRLMPPPGLAGAQPTPAREAPVTWAGPISVRWEVSEDEKFHRIAQQGTAIALPELAHSVHVEARGLAPGRWYHYRFMVGDAVSQPARTRTAPPVHEMPARLRIVHASCQRWEHGFYAAWRHACAEQPDLVVFLGDYVYEYASPRDGAGLARTHALPLACSLNDWRDRYALHKSDPDLQAAHACAPWLVTWDDHEVQNDYAGIQGRGSLEQFLPLRSAAWQAFYEHMPLRASALAGNDGFHHLQLYRHQSWGRLARLHLLDTRQHRDLQACRKSGASAAAVRPDTCVELAQPERTLLGWAQEAWLRNGLAEDARAQGARWTVIAQQTLFSPRRYPSGLQSSDSWDGYPAARQRLLLDLEQTQPRNAVLLGGDIHQNYVCNVHGSTKEASRILASEFCGTSISSRSGTTQDKVDAVARHNPHVVLARCEERGYCVSDITPSEWVATLRAVRDPLLQGSEAYQLARFVVEDGRAGVQTP